MYRDRTKYRGVYKRKLDSGDVCFDISYKLDGKKHWEKVGLLSEGYSEKLASIVRAERIRTIRHGEELPKQKAKMPFFKDVWSKYYAWAEKNKKQHGYEDLSRYETHLKESIGDKRLDEISPFDLERIKLKILKKGLAPATAKHCLVLIRQVYNKAIAWGLYNGPNPVKGVKMPSVQNQRTRFLSFEEAKILLDELKKMKTPDLYDMALLSLQTGLRAGEIFNLKFFDLDFENETIRISDPKNKTARYAHMTKAVKEMFIKRLERNETTPGALVFPDRNGKKIIAISNNFRRVIKRLGFNDGITDPRQMVTFHTLRHTFASWLALQGESLITLKELLGHKSSQMTERYSHLIPDHKIRAVRELEDNFKNHSAEVKQWTKTEKKN